jgi:hypothetical protein
MTSAFRNYPFVVLIVGFTVGWLATPSSVAAGERHLTVVELYTSQGCSSCPPADALLGKLAKEEGILALSFHVDYWDYIGWRDPYAHSSYTKRQKQYAENFRKSFVYTPQLVVHGVSEITGSDEGGVRSLIERAALAPDVPIKLVRLDDGSIAVTVAGSRQPAQAAVWLVLFDSHHKTAVKRGENRGQVVENYNVVRHFEKIGDWQGVRLRLKVAASVLKKQNGDGSAVFLQSERKGPILGAATLALHRPK